MKEVLINNRKKVVMVDGKKVPRLLLTIIRGAVGKCFVVKHYKGKKIVVTRFPDMSKVVASEKQIGRRNLFKEAVVYAKWIIADEERKKAFGKTLPKRKQKNVYQAAIQLYMSKQGDKQWLRKQLAVRGMLSSTRVETGTHQWAIDNRQLTMSNRQWAKDKQLVCWRLMLERRGEAVHMRWGDLTGFQNLLGLYRPEAWWEVYGELMSFN